MPQKSHWPFGGDPWGHGNRGAERDAEEGAKSASTHSAAHQRMRTNRLLVGGRAHVKKSGLS